MKFKITRREDKEIPWIIPFWIIWFLSYILIFISGEIYDLPIFWLLISLGIYIIVFFSVLIKIKRIGRKGK